MPSFGLGHMFSSQRLACTQRRRLACITRPSTENTSRHDFTKQNVLVAAYSDPQTHHNVTNLSLPLQSIAWVSLIPNYIDLTLKHETKIFSKSKRLLVLFLPRPLSIHALCFSTDSLAFHVHFNRDVARSMGQVRLIFDCLKCLPAFLFLWVFSPPSPTSTLSH